MYKRQSEKIPGGNTIEDTLQLIPELEKRGVDAFEISGGSQYELPNKIMPSHGEECATNLKEALRIKEISHVPVLLVGKINEAKLARSLVEEEKVDGIVQVVLYLQIQILSRRQKNIKMHKLHLVQDVLQDVLDNKQSGYMELA